MSKKAGTLAGLLGIFALSMFLLNCGSSDTRPAGLLYVISQAESNISSYSIDLDNGNLSLINTNATTCSTLTQSPPVNCGLPVAISLDPMKATAFVLNQGLSVSSIPPSIYAYTVNSDGSLSAPTSSPTLLPQGDTAVAMSATAAGDLLFVIDQGSNLSAIDCPGNATNGPDCPSIHVFSTKPGSTSITPASVLPLGRIPTALSVLTFAPATGGSTQTLLFMTSNKDLTPVNNDNELSVYSVDSSGNLKELLNSPYSTAPNPTVVLAVNTNPPQQTTGGVFVYVGNQGSTAGSVTAFEVCTVVGAQGTNNTCTQTQVSAMQLLTIGTALAAGQLPMAMVVDPTNSFLYMVSENSSQIFGFVINVGSGVLRSLSPASLPTGAQPVAIAMRVNANGLSNFIFTANNSGESITGFGVDATTGGLDSNPTTTLFTPGLPSGMAAK